MDAEMKCPCAENPKLSVCLSFNLSPVRAIMDAEMKSPKAVKGFLI